MAKRKSTNKPAAKQQAIQSPCELRSPCPVAGTLDIVGDKWTLLVVRDLMLGKKTYGELADSPEKIPTNLLANRLKRLVECGIAEKVAYQQRPVRYEYHLTAAGKALRPVLMETLHWGMAHLQGVGKPDLSRMQDNTRSK